jgi:hypothetical protein
MIFISSVLCELSEIEHVQMNIIKQQHVDIIQIIHNIIEIDDIHFETTFNFVKMLSNLIKTTDPTRRQSLIFKVCITR